MSLQLGRVVSFETFRRERESRRARVLPYLAPAEPAGPGLPVRASPFRGVELTDREVEHRQRMLRHLSDGGVGTPEEVPSGRGRQYETIT
jgi:hypothetical protein